MAGTMRERADAARREFYGREFNRPAVVQRRSHVKRPERIAEPCPGRAPGWVEKVKSLAVVVASRDVPISIKEERLAKCDACRFATIMNGLHYCGCCDCPKWNLGGVSSALEYKCGKAGWGCPAPEPAFDAYVEPENEA